MFTTLIRRIWSSAPDAAFARIPDSGGACLDWTITPEKPNAAADLTPVAVWGPPDACARGLREVAEAGAGMILLNPLFDEAGQMERLAAEVVPQLI